MQIGLDFGTTNTVAACFDGEAIKYIPLQPEASNPIVMPSVLFVGRDRRLLVGQQAIDYYIAANLRRDIIYEQRFLGQIDMHFAGTEGTQGQDISVIRDVHAYIDTNEPGRLFQSLKLALADASYTATDVYGHRLSLEQLIAMLLGEVRRRIEVACSRPVSEVVIGYPVHYSADSTEDALALERMRAACELAELPQVRFMLEPVAAAYSYAMQIEQRCRVLVFDFGGGTLDLTVMELDPSGKHEVLAVAGALVGGDLLTSRIVTGALARYFGEGATLGAARLPLPALLIDSLSDWQQLIGLRTRRSLQIINEAINTSDRPDELKALRSLVLGNHGLQLYREVERAKCRLSEELETTVQMAADDIRITHQLTRHEFELLIAAEVRKLGLCVDGALAAAGLRATQIDTVLMTGGSSRIPRLVRMLAERFGGERLAAQDSFTSIGAGLALAAAAGQQSSMPLSA